MACAVPRSPASSGRTLRTKGWTARSSSRGGASTTWAAGARWQGRDYVASTPTGYIFTGASGTPIQPRAIDKFFAEVRERAGLDVQRFHGLRRIFTTFLDRAGVSDRVVMEMTGHKHLEMTHYYQQPMEVQQREAAARLDGLLRQLRGADITATQ